MKAHLTLLSLLLCLSCQQAAALSLGPEEFQASRTLACVLAEQALGYLSEDEYGVRTHTVLDGFDEPERDNILAKALGYYDGLMFALEPEQVDERLENFVASRSCRDSGFQTVGAALSI